MGADRLCLNLVMILQLQVLSGRLVYHYLGLSIMTPLLYQWCILLLVIFKLHAFTSYVTLHHI